MTNNVVSGSRRIGGSSQGKLKTLTDVTCFLLVLASCLLLCLILFLEQVDLYTSETVDSALLWPYQVNWGSDFIYLFAGESVPFLP